ncbi:MAG: enoyl-CoA hydratase/isomerase family protein [Haloplanus sp.]
MIRTRDRDGVRVVTLDRPERRNALRPTDLDALREAVVDAPTAVVYVHGAGSAFSAGADLDAVASLSSDDAEAFARRGQATMTAIEEASSVVVAGVDGDARGGGVELALACDLRVATPEATLAESGVRLGLFGTWGGTVRLPRVVGASDAFDLALSGRVVDAEEARRMGLVSRVIADPESVAEELAGVPDDALRLVKRRLRDRSKRETQEAAEAAAFADLVAAHGDDVAASRE